MALQRRGGARRKHEDRLRWLSARPDLYHGVPGIHDDVADDGAVRLGALHTQMRDLGLFGSSTPDTQRETIRRLVSELRGEPLGGGAW